MDHTLFPLPAQGGMSADNFLHPKIRTPHNFPRDHLHRNTHDHCARTGSPDNFRGGLTTSQGGGDSNPPPPTPPQIMDQSPTMTKAQIKGRPNRAEAIVHSNSGPPPPVQPFSSLNTGTGSEKRTTPARGSCHLTTSFAFRHLTTSRRIIYIEIYTSPSLGWDPWTTPWGVRPSQKGSNCSTLPVKERRGKKGKEKRGRKSPTMINHHRDEGLEKVHSIVQEPKGLWQLGAARWISLRVTPSPNLRRRMGMWPEHRAWDFSSVGVVKNGEENEKRQRYTLYMYHVLYIVYCIAYRFGDLCWVGLERGC